MLLAPLAVTDTDAERIAASVRTLRSLTSNFEEVAKVRRGASLDDSFDADAVRRELGFVGTSSPLYGIEAALRRACDSDRDGDIEVAELRTDFGRSLQLSSDMAYAAIFADPSGNAGTRGSRGIDFLAKSRKAAVDALAILVAIATDLGIPID